MKNSFFLLHKSYIKTFFSLFNKYIDFLSYGVQTTVYVKGKGLRLQLKTRKGALCIYLKLGYSHKIFLHLPKNCWAKIFGRRRTIKFYSLNAILLKNLVLQIKAFYPMSLYKLRGFYEHGDVLKFVEGKSRLGGNS